MSDWQIGDLAVCVDASGRGSWHNGGLVEGRTYTVSGVRYDGEPTIDTDTVGLSLAGMNPYPRVAYAANRFRKIRPDEREACEPEFVTLLKRSRKTVRA